MFYAALSLAETFVNKSDLVNDTAEDTTATNNKIAQNHFKKILVGVDGSEKSFEAADHAMNLAEKYKSELLLIVNILKIEPW